MSHPTLGAALLLTFRRRLANALLLVCPLLLACPPRATQELTFGDFVLRYALVSRVQLERGTSRFVFSATLENRSAIGVGTVVVRASSTAANAVVAQGRLGFPPLAAGASVTSADVLTIEKSAGRPFSAEEIRFELTSAAPALATSTPADGATGFAPGEWIVLGFDSQPSAEAASGFALACAGTSATTAATPLADGRLVLNPTPALAENADCSLGWVGPGAHATTLGFRTGASGDEAAVRYDRADTTKNNPLPDDFFTSTDGSSATGLRVQIPVPTVDAGTRLIAGSTLQAANRLDGFSPHGPIVLELSEPVDPGSLPARPEASLDPLSPIVLLDLTPGSPQLGERVPFAAQQRSDRIASGPVEHTLFVFPAVQLRRGGRYGLVVARHLRAQSGLRFGLPTNLAAALADPEPGEHTGIAKLRPLVREVAEGAGGLAPPILADDLAFVLRFTVGSLEDASAAPLAMREQVNALPPPVVTIDRVTRTFFGPLAAIVEGTFEAPYWTDGFNLLVRDENGVPEIQGMDRIPFVLALPQSATTTPAPTVFFQHGSPGTDEQVPIVAGQDLAQAGFAVAGFTDSLNRFYGPDSGAQLSGIYFNLLQTKEMPAWWLQTLGEQFAFLRALEGLGELDVLPVGAPDGAPDLDVSRLLYFGQSQGANQGMMFLPYAPEIAAAHLMVGGGRLAESLVHQQPREGSSIIELVGQTFPRLRPSELWSGFHAFQMIFDFQEWQTHATRLYRDPIEVDGTTRKASILWTEGLNDSFSPPTARRAAAHAIGLPLLEPVRESTPILRVEATPASANIDEATTGGVFQYVPREVPGIAPTPGCEYATDGHYCAQLAPASFVQRVRFFQSALGESAPAISNPFVDADEDGLPDFDEIQRGTDPEDPDSDADGMPDGFEVNNYLDPLNEADAAQDADYDGLGNREEYDAGSSPRSYDTDSDGLRDGDEVHVHGTDPTRADTDGGGRPDGVELGRDRTDPLDGSDDLPLRALPLTLTDGGGLTWTVDGTGSLSGGNALFSSGSLRIGTPFANSFPYFQDAGLDGERELVFGPAPLAGLHVTRKVFVSPETSFTRQLEILENRTSSAITTSVFLGHLLFASLAETSSGDSLLDPGDDWLRYAGNSFSSAVVVGFNGRLAMLQPTATTGSGSFSNNSVRFDVTVPPGERVIFLSFHFQSRSEGGALDAVDQLMRLDEPLFDGVSLEERADIVNFFALPDADDDGLADAEEPALGTDPADPDSDGDGLLDGFESRAGLDPLAPGDSASDPDGDGLDNFAEQELETDPALADTDDDGLQDGAELTAGTAPRNPDSDGDGLLDGVEVMLGTNPLDRFGDADRDGLPDADEVLRHGTDPTDPDSDADGLSDLIEVNEYFLDPNDPTDADRDQDGDGLTNLQEFLLGTRLWDDDSDFDDLSDGQEVNLFGTDPLRSDTDGGGRNDRQELISDETDPREPSDDLPTVFLPVRLFDAGGFPWDVQRNGEISGFPSCNACGRLWVGFYNPYSYEYRATAEQSGRELRIDAADVFDVRVRRKVFVSSDDRFARYLDSFENLLAVPQTVTIRLESTLSSFGYTQIVGSSDGDTSAEASDDFVVVDDFEGAGIAAFAFAYSDPSATVQPSSILLDAYGRIEVAFQLTLAPGERRTLMYFLSQNADRASAAAQGQVLRDLGGSALVGLSDAERAQIVNFAPL
jgi:hypothetical protein